MLITVSFSFFACSGCPVFELVTAPVVARVIFILWTSTPLIQDIQLIPFFTEYVYSRPNPRYKFQAIYSPKEIISWVLLVAMVGETK